MPAYTCAVLLQCISQLVPSALLGTVQQKPSFIIFRPHMQAVHDIWLRSPRAPSDFHIENKALPWFDLPCARGAIFNSSCPYQYPPYPGMGKDLALDHRWGLPGSQMRRGLHQRDSLHHPIMSSIECCFPQSHPPLWGFSQMGWRMAPHGLSIL